MALESLATIALAHGEAAAAMTLLASATRMSERIGSPRAPGDCTSVDAVTTAARNAPRADAMPASAVGGNASLDEVLDSATMLAAHLASRENPPALVLPSVPSAPPFGLSGRDREVLQLLVEGHSKPEIAEVLFLSQKTVRNHVTNILAKLGVETRTAAATLAIRHGLY